jgi:hypothetical protein
VRKKERSALILKSELAFRPAPDQLLRQNTSVAKFETPNELRIHATSAATSGKLNLETSANANERASALPGLLE